MNQPTDNQEINRISLAIWQTQMAEVAKKPWLAGIILKHGSRILRRFILFYRRLRAQPRPQDPAELRRLRLELALGLRPRQQRRRPRRQAARRCAGFLLCAEVAAWANSRGASSTPGAKIAAAACRVAPSPWPASRRSRGSAGSGR